MGIKNHSIEKHPSYCIAQFSRCSGLENLFGTSVKPNHYYQFTLNRARKEVTEFGEERYCPDYGDKEHRLFEFTLSANQFAEMITTMNIGNGVPVTLKYEYNTRVAPCPDQTIAIENVIDVAEKQVQEEIEKVNQQIDEALKLLDNKTLSKEDKRLISHALFLGQDRTRSTANFYKEQIVEVGEKVRQEIRTEIDAFTSHAVQKVGLMALGNEKAVKALLEK